MQKSSKKKQIELQHSYIEFFANKKKFTK